MDEHKELKIKNALIGFVREQFVLEGREDLVEEKVLEIVSDLYELVIQITK